MNNDLTKLIVLLWMGGMAYMMFEIWINMAYISDLVHAYISLVMEYVQWVMTWEEMYNNALEVIHEMDKEIEVLRSIIRMQLPVLGEDDKNESW